MDKIRVQVLWRQSDGNICCSVTSQMDGGGKQVFLAAWYFCSEDEFFSCF